MITNFTYYKDSKRTSCSRNHAMRHVTVHTMSFPSSTDAWPIWFSAPMRSRFEPISVVASCYHCKSNTKTNFTELDNHFPSTDI